MSIVSAEKLRSDVVTWLADRIDEVRRRRAERVARQAAQRSEPQGVVSWAKQKARQKAKETLGLGIGQQSVRFQRVDRYAAKRDARAFQEKALASGASLTELESPREVARELCMALGEPAAASAVTAWFDNRAPDEGDAVVDMGSLSWVIGVAAAVAVAAFVLLVRRGRDVPVRSKRLTPSRDFALILDVAKEDGAAADAARLLQSQATEPWRWNLVDRVSGLEEAARRDLLLRLAERSDSHVETIQPEPGARFDPRTMSTADDLNEDDIWVVTEALKPGFTVGGRTLDPARVEVATLDSHVLLDGSCPVGRLLNERADELVPGGRDGAATWRATWGLSHPEDLRELLAETLLDQWRTRMIDGLNEAYRGETARQLVLTGEKGAVFEPSTMDVEGDPPVGDAIVEDLVARDGVPQHGLACPGGSPLLLAVVSVRSSEAS